MHETIFILGGYGNTGMAVADLLLRFSDTRIVLAGRDSSRADSAAAALNAQYSTDRVRAAVVDAASEDALRAAFAAAQADIVVVASSTTAYAGNIARAALDTGADCLDIQISNDKLATLRALEDRIAAAGRCFVTDGGFHPGLPALLVRYAAGRLDALRRATVSSVIKIDWSPLAFSQATLDEMVTEFMGIEMSEFKAGQWRKTSLWTTRTLDFGPPFGRQYTVPMLLEEMRALPDLIPGLVETGFYVGGFNPVTDYVVMPVAMLAMKIAPRALLRPTSRLLEWSLKAFSRPPYGTLLRLDADGTRGGQPAALTLTLSHADGYVMTAAPMVACLLQMLDGSARAPGLQLQAHLMDPVRALDDMARMGVGVTLEPPAS